MEERDSGSGRVAGKSCLVSFVFAYAFAFSVVVVLSTTEAFEGEEVDTDVDLASGEPDLLPSLVIG